MPKQTHKVASPKPNMFDHTVGIDVNFVGDCDGETYMLKNIVGVGAGVQIGCYLRFGQGTPKSLECLGAFMQCWASWIGYPKGLVSDRGQQQSVVDHSVQPDEDDEEAPDPVGSSDE